MNFLKEVKKRGIYYILFLALILCEPATENSNTRFKCGKDNFKPIQLPLNAVVPSKKSNLKYRRTLDSDGFKDFNIFLDLNNFDDEVKKYNLTEKRNFFVEGMQKAIKTLQSLLKVKTTKNYIFYDEDLQDILINKWDETKIGSEMAEKGIGMMDLEIDL